MKTMPFLILSLALIFLSSFSAFSEDRDPFKPEPMNVVFSPEGEKIGHIEFLKGKVILFLKDDPKAKWIKGSDWGIYNREDKLLGKLERKRKTKIIRIYNTKGEMLGAILGNNKFRTRGAKSKIIWDRDGDRLKRTTKTVPINAHATKLYLQVLKVIDQIK